MSLKIQVRKKRHLDFLIKIVKDETITEEGYLNGNR
jgi:hypothetical protein